MAKKPVKNASFPLPPIEDGDEIVYSEDDKEAAYESWRTYAKSGWKLLHDAADAETEELEKALNDA